LTLTKTLYTPNCNSDNYYLQHNKAKLSKILYTMKTASLTMYKCNCKHLLICESRLNQHKLRSLPYSTTVVPVNNSISHCHHETSILLFTDVRNGFVSMAVSDLKIPRVRFGFVENRAEVRFYCMIIDLATNIYCTWFGRYIYMKPYHSDCESPVTDNRKHNCLQYRTSWYYTSIIIWMTQVLHKHRNKCLSNTILF